EALCQGQHVATRRPGGAGAEQRVDHQGGGGPRLSLPVSRTPSMRASARLSIASSVLGSSAATQTGIPLACSARATTHPSPPLFPAPATISAPRESTAG